MVEYKDYHCVIKCAPEYLCKSFYYMFKLYNLFRDNLKMEIYLFKDQIQVSWKKTCHFQQYFSYIVAIIFICGGQQWIAGIHLKTFESQKLNNIYMGRFGKR